MHFSSIIASLIMDNAGLLHRTPLYNLHVELGAKMVPFAGWEMPVQYREGIIKEHLHTRGGAGFFDISHMGQVVVTGGSDIRTQIETIMPGDFEDMERGQIRYSFLLNEDGGVIDDLMVTRPKDLDEQDSVFIIVNASGRTSDLAQIRNNLPHLDATLLTDRALIALQGPKAAVVLGKFCDAPAKLKFMQADKFAIQGVGLCFISRSGYTGEDGFEISVPAETVETFARSLLVEPDVAPIGLGARDSLRLEAGLCLYGHDLDPSTTPVEANLVWALGKRQRATGRFIGGKVILRQLAEGATKKRVGILPEGRALARDGTDIMAGGQKIGVVTSGGFGPSVNGPVCMGYVNKDHAKTDTAVTLVIRGKDFPAKIVKLPFVPHRYMKE